MRLVSRSEWGAEAPRGPIGRIGRQPTAFVHHTVVPHQHPFVRDYPARAACRLIQQAHFREGYSDVGYTHMVDDDGVVYEGRGWGTIGGHTFGWNERSYAVAFLGNTELGPPSRAALGAIAAVIAWGRADGWLTPDCRILGHKDAPLATACPGSNLYAVLPTIRTLAQEDAMALAPDERQMLETIHRAVSRSGMTWDATIEGIGVSVHHQQQHRTVLAAEDAVQRLRALTPQTIGAEVAQRVPTAQAIADEVARRLPAGGGGVVEVGALASAIVDALLARLAR